MRRFLIALFVLCAAPAFAQTGAVSVTGSITANGQAVILRNLNGRGSAKVQVTGTYNTTWEVQCAVDGVNFDADDEVPITRMGATSTVDEVTADDVSIWDLGNVAACSAVQVIATAYTSGTQVVTLSAAPTGGGGGSGGAASVVPISQTGTANDVDANLAQVAGATVSATNPVPTRAANSAGYIADDVAEAAASSGNPVPVGGLVNTSNAAMTLLANAARGYVGMDADRAIYVRLNGSAADWVNSTPIDVSSGASTSALSAAGVGIKYSITDVFCANPVAGSDVQIDLRDGTAGAVKATIPCPKGGAMSHQVTPITGFTANTAVAVDPSAASTGLTVTLLGFKSKL